jgi:hypothetical protein
MRALIDLWSIPNPKTRLVEISAELNAVPKKVAGRAESPDVADYRSGLKQLQEKAIVLCRGRGMGVEQIGALIGRNASWVAGVSRKHGFRGAKSHADRKYPDAALVVRRTVVEIDLT